MAISPMAPNMPMKYRGHQKPFGDLYDDNIFISLNISSITISQLIHLSKSLGQLECVTSMSYIHVIFLHELACRSIKNSTFLTCTLYLSAACSTAEL